MVRDTPPSWIQRAQLFSSVRTVYTDLVPDGARIVVTTAGDAANDALRSGTHVVRTPTHHWLLPSTRPLPRAKRSFEWKYLRSTAECA